MQQWEVDFDNAILAMQGDLYDGQSSQEVFAKWRAFVTRMRDVKADASNAAWNAEQGRRDAVARGAARLAQEKA